MSAHILLDTSPIIAHLRGKLDLDTALPAGNLIFTSLFTVGELEKGIHGAKDPERERGKVNLILEHVAVIMPDSATAQIYGRVSRELELQGKKIPENDLWIASIALEGGLQLATGDSHFSRIDDLEMLLISW